MIVESQSEVNDDFDTSIDFCFVIFSDGLNKELVVTKCSKRVQFQTKSADFGSWCGVAD